MCSAKWAQSTRGHPAPFPADFRLPRDLSGAETVGITGFLGFARVSVSVKLQGQNKAAWEYMNLLSRSETAADTTAELGCGLLAARVL